MSLNDPRFINFDGSSVTGRVPPALRVAEGRELTPTQAGAVAHAYKLFKDAANVSVAEFLVQNRTLSDGTRVRLVSIQGQDTVTVWPTGGEKKSFVLRGFVIAPIAVSGSALSPEKIDEAILTAVDKWAKWVPLRYRYRPGEKREALAYMVTNVPFVGKEVKGILTKFTTWAGKLIRGILPVSDAEYNDVFARHGDTVYRNAVPVFRLPAGLTDGYPAIFEATPGDYKMTVASNQMIQGITTLAGPPVTHEATVGYDWTTISTFIVPGEEFRCGVEIVATSAKEYRANFLAYNITSVGATQTWVATAKILPSPPFAAIELQELNQLGLQAMLNSNDGWNSGVVTTGAAKLIPLQNPKTLKLGYTYVDDPSDVVAGNVLPTGEISVGAVTWSGGSLTTHTFDRTHSAPETVKLNATENIAITRSAKIETTRKYNSSTYHLAWPYATPLNRYGGQYVMLGSPDWGTEFAQGALLVSAGYEGISTLAHKDTGICKVEVPRTPSPVWDVSVEHHLTGAYGGVMEYPARDFSEGYAPQVPTGNYSFYLSAKNVPTGLWMADGGGPHSPRSEQYTAVDSYDDTHTFTAKSRDYIFSDRANDVFVWIECEITSTKTGNTSGTSSTVIRSCIRFNGADHNTVLFSASYSEPRDIYQVAPWGIAFGTDPLAWSYHQPPRPHPIYAPLWQDQGLCPYLAYTVRDEGSDAAPAPPRIAAYFRLQLERRYRSPLEPELPFLKNVVGFSPYMMQQLLGNYGHVGGTSAVTVMKGIFNLLEAQPTIIKLALPDADLFANVGAPTDDAHYAKFYRT